MLALALLNYVFESLESSRRDFQFRRVKEMQAASDFTAATSK